MENVVSKWDWRGWPHVLTFLLLACLAAPHTEAAPICKPLSADSRNATIEWYPRDALLAGANPESFYVVTWWCDAKFYNQPYYVVGYLRDLPGNFISYGRELLGMTLGDFQAAWETGIKVKSPCKAGAPENVYTPLCATMRKQQELTLPEPPGWFVRDNPTATTRPCFTGNRNADGAWIRNTTALPNTACRVADSNSRCLPTHIVSDEGTNVYASVMGLPNLGTAQSDDVIGDNIVALCVRTN